MLKSVLIDYNPIALLINKTFEKVSLFADISNYIKNLIFDKDDANLEKLLFLIGVGAITYQTGQFLHLTFKNWSWLPGHIVDTRKFDPKRLK